MPRKTAPSNDSDMIHAVRENTRIVATIAAYRKVEEMLEYVTDAELKDKSGNYVRYAIRAKVQRMRRACK